MARHEQDIDGKNYSFGYWQVDPAIERLTLFVEIFGSSLATFLIGGAKAAQEQDNKALDTEVTELDFIKEGIESLIPRLKEDKVKKLVKDFQQNLMCDNKKVSDNYNEHYKGQLGHMFKVIAAQARYQFADFLGLIKGLKAIG